MATILKNVYKPAPKPMPKQPVATLPTNMENPIWAGGSYGRGYAQRRYGMAPTAFGYRDGNITINDNPIYKAQVTGGKAYIHETELPSYQQAIDRYAQTAGFAPQKFNPESNDIYRQMRAAYENTARQAGDSAMAKYGGVGGDTAQQVISQNAYAGQMNKLAEMLPALEQQDYGRFMDNRTYLDQQEALQREINDKAMQRQIDTVGQYYGDYQAEINRRMATPDKADDALIPYLQIGRQNKIATQKKEAQELKQLERENKLKEKKDAREERVTNYELNKPYYAPRSINPYDSTMDELRVLKMLDDLYGGGKEKPTITFDDVDKSFVNQFGDGEKVPDFKINWADTADATQKIQKINKVWETLKSLQESGVDGSYIDRLIMRYNIPKPQTYTPTTKR